MDFGLTPRSWMGADPLRPAVDLVTASVGVLNGPWLAVCSGATGAGEAKLRLALEKPMGDRVT